MTRLRVVEMGGEQLTSYGIPRHQQIWMEDPAGLFKRTCAVLCFSARALHHFELSVKCIPCVVR
jgi:hypothetical protein